MSMTPTQQKMFDILSDWGPHPWEDLRPCLWDEANENPRGTVKKHVSNLRKVLGPMGMDVVSRGANGTTVYRLVRHVSSGE